MRANWFGGFTLDRVDVGEVMLRVRYGGAGLPVLLLHGQLRTHVTWHRVAPLLARAYRGLPGPAGLRQVVETADGRRSRTALQTRAGR